MREIHEMRREWTCPLAHVSPDIVRARLLFCSLTVRGHSSFYIDWTEKSSIIYQENQFNGPQNHGL